MTRYAVGAGLLLLLASLVLAPSLALVSHGDKGRWPADWPEELEPLRDQSQTIGVATGLQMNIYQIPFADREQFESVWPALLSVKSEGGTLTLVRLNADANGWPAVSNEKPCVRVLAPARSTVRVRKPGETLDPDPPGGPTYDQMQELVAAGQALNTGPPWPDSAYLPNGQLAEYVTAQWVDDRLTWVATEHALDANGRPTWVTVGDGTEVPGFLNRARVDFELVVDGDVVDLNRIHIPPNTPILDKRGLMPEEE